MTCPDGLKANDATPMASASRSCRQDEIQGRSPVRHCPKGSDRGFENIPSVVSKIDHDIWSRRRKLFLSPHCLWLRLLRVGSAPARAPGFPERGRIYRLLEVVPPSDGCTIHLWRVARRSICASMLLVCLSANSGRTKMDARSHETIQ